MQSCPRPGCKRAFFSGRALSSHLSSKNSGKCYLWCSQELHPSSPRQSSPPPAGSRDGSPSSSEGIGAMPWKRPWGRRTVRFRREADEIIENEPRTPSACTQAPFLPPEATSSPSPPPDAPPSPSSAPNPKPNAPQPLPKFVKHPNAAQCFGYGPTTFDRIKLDDQFRKERKTNIYYPFSCEEDMEMGLWLAGQGLSVNQIDNFLKLKYVRC